MSFTFQDIGEAAAGCNCACSGSPTPCTCTTNLCNSCALPEINLTLTINGTTVTTLIWNSGSNNWSDGTHTIACNAFSQITLTGGGTWTRGTVVCNPFNVTFTSSGNTAVVSLSAPCSCCNFSFCTTGYGGGNLQGSLIQIYTNSGMGTLIGSGTTGITGCVVINVGSAGTYWQVITAFGFNPYSGSVTVTCGGTSTVNMQTSAGIITGYGTCTGCANPTAPGLSLTGPSGISGSLVLTPCTYLGSPVNYYQGSFTVTTSENCVSDPTQCGNNSPHNCNSGPGSFQLWIAFCIALGDPYMELVSWSNSAACADGEATFSDCGSFTTPCNGSGPFASIYAGGSTTLTCSPFSITWTITGVATCSNIFTGTWLVTE